MQEFKKFPKIPRFNREVVITEKIDGTNAQICIEKTDYDGQWRMRAGSRNRWLSEDDDNFGFAAWVKENEDELWKLGPGNHYGEWWGHGIQRGYALSDRRFSLFNVSRWHPDPKNYPDDPYRCAEVPCCHVVPLLAGYKIPDLECINDTLNELREFGSLAAPGKEAEGIVIFHTAANQLFKILLHNDEIAKGQTC